jgi:hypothetical protein
MLRRGNDLLYRRVVELLPDGAAPVRVAAAPVLGAVLAALDDAGAGSDAKSRVREELGDG